MAPKSTASKVQKVARRNKTTAKHKANSKDSQIDDLPVTLIAPATRMTPSHIIFFHAQSPLSNFHPLAQPFSGASAMCHLLRLLASVTYCPDRSSKPVPIPHPDASSLATQLVTASHFHTVEQFLMACKGWAFEPLSLTSPPSPAPITSLLPTVL